MAKIRQLVLLATVVVFAGAAWTSDVDARNYVKELNSSEVVAPDHLGGDRERGDDTVVVPEPGTIALLSVGLASLAAARRRRKQQEAAG
ncbi:MAG: hypothetical protein DHS20C21_04560 [Gemmatimonadota bacterium]|nr:MAG: hypothetical protein DHS20C21_04560 [Gemmatimonadota bacterium]